MSLFSSKTRYYLDTSVVRVVEDHQVPNVLIKAVITAIIKRTNISQTLFGNILNGSYQNFERMHQYAKSGGYHFGLPNVKYLKPSDGLNLVKPILDDIAGVSVDIDYGYFLPPNNVHLARQHIEQVHGYDFDSNEITGLSNSVGFPVYLKDIEAIYSTTAQDAEYDSRGTIGDSPLSGFTPERLGRSGLNPRLDLRQTWSEDPEKEGAIVYYVWEDAEGNIQEGQLDLDFSAYDLDREYYQFQYRYTPDGETESVVKYWTYDPEDKQYPALDAAFFPVYDAPGTFFPFVVFRSEYSNRASSNLHNTQEYITTKKLLEYLRLDYQTISDQIHQNPDIGDVAQSVMMMAIPAASQYPLDIEYLYLFFDELSKQTLTVSPDVGINLNAVSPATQAVVIQDSDFKVTLTYRKLTKKLIAGSIGEVGKVTNTTETIQVDTPGGFFSASVNQKAKMPTGYITLRYLRKQLTEGVYAEIEITGLESRYYIDKGRGTIGRHGDESLLIPLDRHLITTIPLHKREELYHRSLHMVFNSFVEEKSKWYESSFFRAVLIFAAVVITVVSLGKAWQTIVAAAQIGVTAVVLAVLEIIVVTFGVQVALDWVTEQVGARVAFVIAVVAMVWGSYSSYNTPLDAKNIWAENLLRLSNGLVQAINTELGELNGALKNDLAELQLLEDERQKELERANALLYGNLNVDPFLFIGLEPELRPFENPEDFFLRTVHTGNIGVIGTEILQSFVDLSLTLPNVQDTLGDQFNEYRF